MTKLAPLAVLGAATLILTGCGVATPPAATVTVTATPSATSLPALTFPPISGYTTGLDCDQVAAAVLPAGSGYTVSGLLAGESATADALASANGIACGFTDPSNHLIVVGIAQLDGSSYDAVKAYYAQTAAATTAYTGSTPPDGVAYFDTSDGLGEANEFYTGYWFYAASKDYGKAADPTSVVNSLWENFAPKA